MEHADYRRDIDGLRAIAVTAVVLYHAAAWILPSGFVGVDVFFVISGYLIGGIVYRSTLRGNFSFADFYTRRAKRILPALIAVVTVFGLIGLFMFDAQEMEELAGQSVLALVGASNFYFWKHTNYFATAANQEPLLMTWSLGVEEQFYIFFPAIIIVISRLRVQQRLRLLFAAVCVSLILSIYLALRFPITAFYMLPPRAWEMGIGAILTMIHHDVPRTTRAGCSKTQALAILSLVGLAASLTIFNDETTFPGWAVMLPVLSTLGLLQTRASWVNRVVLSSRPFVWIGLISYSWYLWHWPLMALARRVADRPPSSDVMLAIAAFSLGLAALSWRFIEQPFRRSSPPKTPVLPRFATVIGAAVALMMFVKVENGLPGRLSDDVRRIEAAQIEGRGNCLAGYGDDKLPAESRCSPPGATIAILGDSHASAIGPGVVAAAHSKGIKVAQFTKSACLPLLGYQAGNRRPEHPHQCSVFLDRAIARIVNDPAIRTVLLAGAWPDLTDRNFLVTGSSRQQVPATTAVWNGLSTMAHRLMVAGKKVILIGDVPPLTFSPPEHLISEAIPARRTIAELIDGPARIRGTIFSMTDARPGFTHTRDYVASLARDKKLSFFDPTLQMCDQGLCAFVRNSTPVYFDTHHLTVAGPRMINWYQVLS